MNPEGSYTSTFNAQAMKYTPQVPEAVQVRFQPPLAQAARPMIMARQDYPGLPYSPPSLSFSPQLFFIFSHGADSRLLSG